MPGNASGQRRGASKESWINRAVDILKPQPGPYDNSFLGDVKSHTAWVDTYFPTENEKRPHKKR
jgi:hypothetical protein